MVASTHDSLIGSMTSNRAAILADWEAAVSRFQRPGRSSPDLPAELSSLYDAIVSGLESGGDVRSEGMGEARALLTEMSFARARQGYTPTETASAVFALKEPVRVRLPEKQVADFVEFSALMDQLGLFTFETFASARESVIMSQTEQLLELSTPVVKLWDGVLAVPLVGTLDSARTQVVMETLLQTLVDTGSAHAIIDITGVGAVDTQVAQHLSKTVIAARLMGAECIISGIRPQIAQTVVALGIEFGDIPTKATLADALRHVLRQAGFDIVRRAERS